MSQPPQDPSADSGSGDSTRGADFEKHDTGELPAPTRAEAATSESTLPAATPRGSSVKQGARKVLFIAGGVVVLAIVIFILVLTLGGGDGTKQMANPLEVRQLVATFDCTANNPGAPSAIRVTAGQEVVQLGRGGCAVVGPVIDKVDRAKKVKSAGTDNGCTVTIESSAKYGGIVDKASVVNNGYARALVAGGYILDLRARLYAPTKDSSLSVTFSATNQSACTKVADALKLG